MLTKLQKEEREKQIEKVEFALLSGFSPREISKQINMSLRQVQRFRKIIRKRNLDLFRKSSPEDRLADLQADMKAIRDQAMTIANSAKSDRDKISALSLLQRQTDAKFNQYKDLGYVDVLPQKLEVSGEVTLQDMVRVVKDNRKKEEGKDEKTEM